MCAEDKELWLTAFDRTGFALEYRTQQTLREHGWNVINSRYYVDDKTGAEREIDIVAYKKRAARDADCYTYLMVSCKKSHESSWVFLTSDHGSSGGDFDPCPLGLAASAPEISGLIASEKPLVINTLLEREPYRRIFDSPHKILSSQQFNRKSHRPEDDRRIFDSIITTIKAAAYEKKYALAHRPDGRNIFLDFHLLSVFEGGLKENYRSGPTNEINDIAEIKYINRHIIDNADRSYRVHFISSDAFAHIISQYDDAAEALPGCYTALCDEFYGDIFSPAKKDRLAPFWEEFRNNLFGEMFDERYCEPDRDFYNNSWLSGYEMDRQSNMLLLYWDLSFFSSPEDDIAELNESEPLLKKTARKLEEYFHYAGPFKFVLEPHPYFSP